MSNNSLNKEADHNVEKMKNIQISIEVKPANNIDTSIYEGFYNRYRDMNMSSVELSKLMEIYDKGNQLLNQYYIQCENNTCKTDIIVQIQYVLGQLNHNINTILHSRLQAQLAQTNKLNKDMQNAKSQMRNIQKILKEITTTIISIILAVSIIPTAVSGIQNIDGKYILPFISSISLIGMSSILYVYLIHQVKVNKWAIGVYIISIAVTIMLWLLTWKINITMIPKS